MKKKISKSNFNIFREIRIPNNSTSQNYKLPSLIMNKNKNSIKKYENLGISMSNSNLSKNNIFKMQFNPKITSSTNYNIRNSHTMEIQKSLDTSKISKGNKTPKVKLEKDKEKLQNLVNCFKELDDSNPKTKYDIKNLKELNNKTYNKEISNTFTKFYRISRHQQKLDVIKLNTWDEENLESFYGNTNIIYNYLVSYFIKQNNKKKLDELEYFKRIIDSNGNFVDNLLKNNPNNKIIQNFRDQKNLEQGTILHNIISKTHNRFRNDLMVKDKKISINFGLDNDAFAAMKKEKDMGTVYYGKVIKEKEKQEAAKREELMNLSIKILNKKREKELKENNIGKNYEETNNVIKKFNSKILKINEEIHENKEIFKRIQNIEVPEGEDMNKKNQLSRIQLNRDKLEMQLLRTKYELNLELKNLDKKKHNLIEELEIIKNELLFMKIAHVYLTKEQRNYYLDLLNKGYDIRNEGLVWIVKRLLEIQTKLEYHHFPKYLDKDQADYIIELANINLEEAQLKIVIDVLQKKQNNRHNKFNKEMIQKIIVLSNKRKSQMVEENIAKYKTPKKEEKFKFEDKITTTIHDIYKKYESAFKINNLKKFDDMREKQIIEELKISLLEGGRNGPHENLDELEGLLEFLNNNGENKDYFEFILKLKLRMRLLSKKKEALKQKQVFLFRESLDNDNRFNYAESSLKYDLVWGALFGNRFITC
jgi:hypothetical protein